MYERAGEGQRERERDRPLMPWGRGERVTQTARTSARARTEGVGFHLLLAVQTGGERERERDAADSSKDLPSNEDFAMYS